jgi:NAD+ dependent glucose-6-phosphate dehydrogenase
LRKTVLITGSGGLIGSILRTALSDSYTIRSHSLEPIPGVDTVLGDITDIGAMRAACQGVDSVVHLAASGSVFSSWERVLHNNIQGTYTLYEAAWQAGVKQVIFASSNHAVGTYDLLKAPQIYQVGQPLLDHTVITRPDSLYGVSKCFGEDLGKYYADWRGMRVICLRIGVVTPYDYPRGNSEESFERLAAIWLSHRDLVQLVDKCLLADHVQFDIFYGISNNIPRFYDLNHAWEVIGYEPQDSISERMAQVRAQQLITHDS